MLKARIPRQQEAKSKVLLPVSLRNMSELLLIDDV
jgi:hypothetical protein